MSTRSICIHRTSAASSISSASGWGCGSKKQVDKNVDNTVAEGGAECADCVTAMSSFDRHR